MLKQCVETMGVVRESKGKLGSKKLSSAQDTVSKKHASAVKKGPAKHGKPLKAKDEVTQNPTKKKSNRFGFRRYQMLFNFHQTKLQRL